MTSVDATTPSSSTFFRFQREFWEAGLWKRVGQKVLGAPELYDLSSVVGESRDREEGKVTRVPWSMLLVTWKVWM